MFFFRFALVLFFLTGISGLIYQVVWVKQMTLTFGVTSFATSTVLSAFMGGLGLGSYLAGRLFRPRQNALRVYGLLEIGVGLSALILPSVWQWLTPIYQGLVLSPLTAVIDIAVWRFGLSFLSLCIPVTFMGATLPVITQGLISNLNQIGQRVGRLYALNTLGAMIGALSAGFLLIGLIGIQTTTRLAVTINLGVGALAVLMSIRWQAPQPEITAASNPRLSADAEAINTPTYESPVVFRLVLLTMFIAGFVGLTYEVIWTRVLLVIFTSTVYSFAAMLTMVLLGIALGSFVVSRKLDNHNNPLALLGLVEFLLGVFALVWVFQVAHTFRITPLIEQIPIPQDLRSVIVTPLAISFWSLLIPTVLMGMTFPLATKIGAQSVSRLGQSIGKIYAINVLGGVLGAWAGGFVLLPTLGAQKSIWLLAALSMVVGLTLLWSALPRRRYVIGVLSCIAFLVLLSGVILPDVLFAPLFRDKWPQVQVLANLERVDGMVTVGQGGPNRTIYVNGYPQSTTAPYWLQTYHLLGLLPNLLKADSQSMLVVGFGGGVTSGVASLIPDLKLQVIELSPGMLEAAVYFQPENYFVLQNPRVTFRIDDGRNYMLLNPMQYDTIVADTITPINAYANNLYSLEYFQLLRSRLKDDGVFLQWINHFLPPAQYKLIMRTFVTAFPDAILWQEQDRLLLIGSKNPISLQASKIQQRYGSPELADSRKLLGYPTASDLIKPFTPNGKPMSGTILRELIGDGPILTDDQPLLEYSNILIMWERRTGQNLFEKKP